MLPEDKGLKVSYRVNGLLQQYFKLDKRISKSLVARFKIVALMDITERRLPQDGRFKVTLNNRPVEFRVSCMPGQHGENLVLRILNKNNDATGLNQLGLDTKDVETIRHITRSTHGMMLVTGPTGSGKSSTLAAVLRDLTDEPKHMLSLEDPIEIEVPGINQIQMHEKIGFTFASALRNVLRHDPDIIMLGEIRDAETAKISVQAALTGHVLISTLHTNSAAAAFSRLSDMGVEPYLVAATVKGIMAQQLLPQLCAECRLTQKPDDKIIEFFTRHEINTKDLIDHASPGCDHCRDSGISGRILVYEFLAMNRELQELVSKEATLETMQATACKLGMRTIVQMAVEASQKGLVSLDRILPLFIE
jgi:type IV pilus assembly protein PilB